MRRAASAIRLAGWAVVAGLGLLALVRAVHWETRTPTLIALYGVGGLPYLAALPVAAAALARRHVRLGVVALAVASASLPTALPELAARDRVPAGAWAAPRLRILSWNIYRDNTDAAAMDEVVRRADADVVLLQEISSANFAAVLGVPALASYAHSYSSPATSAFGSGIWSRLPLEGGEDFDVGGLPMTRAEVQSPSGPVRVVNVHTLSADIAL